MLDRSVEVHLPGAVEKRNLGEFESGTVCELLDGVVKLFLILLVELELRVAVGSLIILVDEEAVEVLSSPSLSLPLVFVFLHKWIINKELEFPETPAAFVKIHEGQEPLGIVRRLCCHEGAQLLGLVRS